MNESSKSRVFDTGRDIKGVYSIMAESNGESNGCKPAVATNRFDGKTAIVTGTS